MLAVVFGVGMLIFAGVLLVSAKGRKKDGSSATARPDPAIKRGLSDPPDPFDEKGAKPVHSGRTVTGPAYVTDGDTLVIKKVQVRLFGIDAPELDHPFGQKAKWAMVKLCKGHTVRAEVIAEDSHGRTVARCYLPDGRDLSAELVKQGLAIDWPKYSGGVYRDLEVDGARKKLWLADARQKGRMHVWAQYEAKRARAHR